MKTRFTIAGLALMMLSAALAGCTSNNDGNTPPPAPTTEPPTTTTEVPFFPSATALVLGTVGALGGAFLMLRRRN